MSASYPYPEETMNLRALPKIELHLHLDCCLSYDVVQRLDPSVTPEAFARDFVAPPKCRSLAEYLRTPPHHVALMQSEEALRLVVDDLFAQLARDGVIYAEIRFAPLFHTRRGLSSEQVVAIVDDAVARRARPAASKRGSSWRRSAISARRRAWRPCAWSSVSAARTWSRSTSRATRRATRSTRTWPRSVSPASTASRHGPRRGSGRAGERVGDAAAAPAVADRPRRPQHRGRGAHGAPGRDRHPPGGVPDLQRADRCRAGVRRSSGGQAVPAGHLAGHQHRHAHRHRRDADAGVRAAA